MNVHIWGMVVFKILVVFDWTVIDNSNNNTTKLAGYYKIKLLKLGIRIVYGLVKEDEKMTIVVISVREDEAVYKLADKRIK